MIEYLRHAAPALVIAVAFAIVWYKEWRLGNKKG